MLPLPAEQMDRGVCSLSCCYAYLLGSVWSQRPGPKTSCSTGCGSGQVFRSNTRTRVTSYGVEQPAAPWSSWRSIGWALGILARASLHGRGWPCDASNCRRLGSAATERCMHMPMPMPMPMPLSVSSPLLPSAAYSSVHFSFFLYKSLFSPV